MSVTVKTQAELNQALADKADTIYIESGQGVWLTVTDPGSSSVVAWGSSSVVAWGSSSVEAWGSSSVVARGSSRVEAWGSSSVEARDSSSVVARGSSSVEARDSSSVEARDSSSVVAWGSSSVEARDSSSVVASGSSSVEASGSSSVEASGSSSVEASGSSSVVARGSSRVEASKYVAVHLWSKRVTINGDGHVIDCTAIDFSDPAQWCEFHGVTVEDGIAYLFKAVNAEWTTDRGTDYSPGSLPEAPDWNTRQECGGGLHLCARPMLSAAYLGDRVYGRRFLKVGVRLDELVTLDDKVKARRVVIACVEVDRFGDVVEAVSA